MPHERPALLRAIGAYGLEYACAHELLVRHAAHTLDHATENDVTKIRVCELFARIEVERHSLHVADQRFSGCRRRRANRGGGDSRAIDRIESAIRFATIPPAGVVEQMPNRD